MGSINKVSSSTAFDVDANIQTCFVFTNIMAKKILDTSGMPDINKRVYELILEHTDGNVSKFAEIIGVKQTQHYARLLGKKVVSDMAKLLISEDNNKNNNQ